MVQNKEALINLVKPSDLVVEHVLFLQQIFLTLLIAFPDGVTLSFLLYFLSLPCFTSSILQNLLVSLAISSLRIFCCAYRRKALWEKQQSKAMKVMKGINCSYFHSFVCTLFPSLSLSRQLQEFQTLEQLQTALKLMSVCLCLQNYKASGLGWAKFSSGRSWLV